LPRRGREHRAAVLQRLATRLDGANTAQRCLVHVVRGESAGVCSACGARAEDATEPVITLVDTPTPSALPVDDSDERAWDE
jgi:hypothetical protein